MRICFLDTIGLMYNGDTLNIKGLGGSESAIILLTKELVKIGMDVTVYCKCDAVGVYDGVEYRDINTVVECKDEYDILVSSRSVLPFAPGHILGEEIFNNYGVNVGLFENVYKNSKYKMLWMHDTFCSGDEYMQNLLVDRYFDEVATLSDWHGMYVSTANHGDKRLPEIFKSRMFHTRNGIVNYGNKINLEEKDKNLFIFNASISKGMKELLDELWPDVKLMIPEAKLVVVGGYYDFVDLDPNSFQNQCKALIDKHEGKNDVTFTGIIKQSEVAELLTKATYFLYPNIYPETFGISVTEAVNYNCLLIGFNYGALEEIAPSSTSYQAEFCYGFRDISKRHILEQVHLAYFNDYLRQQKQYACNEFKPFLGWEVVALQWKHHLYHKLGLYLTYDEITTHRKNIGSINRIYKKHMVNPEEVFEDYSSYNKNNLIIISPVYNAEKYVKDMILSVAGQNYKNYLHVIVDDMSTDNTVSVIKDTFANLTTDMKSKFTLVECKDKRYALGNQVAIMAHLIETHPDETFVVVLLDGDDTLVNDPDIFNFINREYATGAKFTYGSCKSMADNLDLVAQPYPDSVIENKTFREHKFTWGMPYTHLRTFSSELFNKVPFGVYLDENNKIWKTGGDNATFYPYIELCEKDEIRCIQKILVNYNDLNPINDYKVNGEEQNKNAEKIKENIL